MRQNSSQPEEGRDLSAVYPAGLRASNEYAG